MVDVRILEPGDEAAAEAFLLPRIESSMFLLSNMRRVGLADGDERYHGTYAGAFDSDGRLISIAGHFWNHNVILQAPVHLEALCRAAAEASGRKVRGVVGPASQAAVCIDLFDLPEYGERVQFKEHEGLYTLGLDRLRLPDALAEGKVLCRLLEAQDREAYIDMLRAYEINETGRKPGEALEKRLIEMFEHGHRERDEWVLEADSDLVAMSGFNAKITEAVQIGGVYTRPELRGRGYGRCVVAASLRDTRAEGVERAILFTGEQNVAAIRVYQSLGFERIGDYRILILHGA